MNFEVGDRVRIIVPDTFLEAHKGHEEYYRQYESTGVIFEIDDSTGLRDGNDYGVRYDTPWPHSSSSPEDDLQSEAWFSAEWLQYESSVIDEMPA